MSARLTISIVAFSLMILCASRSEAAPAVVYVSVDGNNNNSGTSVTAPKQTIQAGADIVGAGGTVYIEPGTYTGAGNEAITFGPNPDAPMAMVFSSDPNNGGTAANTIINLKNENEPAFEIGSGMSSSSGLFGLTIENFNSGGSAVSIEGGSPTIENCIFTNNESGAAGGAIILANSNASIQECSFTDNSAPGGYGGAIEIETTNEVSSGTFAPQITNCLFSGNSASGGDGAAIDISNGLQPIILDAEITNCTFTGNTSVYSNAGAPGGAVGMYSSNATFTNNIFYGDTVMNGSNGGEITTVNLDDGSPNPVITANYNDIEKSSGTYPGTNNINQKPLLNPAGDLAAGSPCINTGTPSVPSGVNITIDITGRDRYLQPDMGAYEVLPPVANNQGNWVDVENSPVSFTIVATDPNVTPRSLTYTVTNSPSDGVLSGTAPDVTYTPNNGFYGTDSFTFTAYNGTYSSSLATVGITVLELATANSQSVTTNENTAVGITLTGSDPNGASLSYTVATSPTHGTLSGTAPNLTYTPNSGYYGADSFTFTDTDRYGATSVPATVSITVIGAPTANSQSVNVGFNTATAVTLTGSDPNSPAQSLTYSVGTPAHGALSGTAPNLTYTPNAGYTGGDSFTFTVKNTSGLTSLSATVTLSITAGVPTANGRSVTVGENSSIPVTLTGSDPDSPALPLTYTVATEPSHGTLSGSAPNLTYTPTAGYYGSDSFTFTVSNGENTSASATVSITVVGQPIANGQSVTTPQGFPVSVTLTGSDPNTPAQPLAYMVTGGPTNGTLSGAAPNLTYTPNAGFNGSDSFTFTVSNGTVTSAPATVNIAVTPVLASVTAEPKALIGDQTGVVTINLTGPAPAGGVVVNLRSGNTAAAKVSPIEVTVPAGSSTVTAVVKAYPVTTDTLVELKADYIHFHSCSITVLAPIVQKVEVLPSKVIGGAGIQTGTVTLSSPAAAVTTVNLASNNPNAIVPGYVLVQPGHTTATFQCKTRVVDAEQTAVITATGSTNSATYTVTIKPQSTSTAD